MSRPVLAPNAIAPEILESMSSFHPEVVKTVSDTVAKAPVVVIGMAGNPFVKKARKALNEAGVEYEYLEYGNYLGQWRQRLAIKLWSGFPTFPQVFVKGVLIGGATELKGAITDGSLQKRLAYPNGKSGKSPVKKKTTDKK
ncbi:MAG: glutaredoxin [Oligoflexus sp.]|nr:glutaredoxin [Oligoflexus sp.]